MTIRRLTNEERNMIRYFHEERGDLTRWAGWEDALPVLERWHPELLKAYRDVEIAEKILDLVVRSLETEED